MMIFNKLQGFTLVSLLFLFNVRPYDFAEDVGGFLEKAEEISGEMAEVFETAVKEGNVDAEHIQEFGETITKALGDSFTEGFGDSFPDKLGESLAQAVEESITEEVEKSLTEAIREAVSEVAVGAADAQDIKHQITLEFAKEAKSQEITKFTQDKLKGLPKLKQMLKPKIMGVVVAIIIVVAVMVKFYLGRRPADWPKYMEEQVEKLMSKEVSTKLTAEDQSKVKGVKATLKEKIRDLVTLGNVTTVLESATPMYEIMKKAHAKLGIKMGDMATVFNQMFKMQELKDFKPEVDYAKALREAMNKTPEVPAECTTALRLYDADWASMTNNYSIAYSSEKEAEKWLTVMRKSDADLAKVDLAKSADENLSKDK